MNKRILSALCLILGLTLAQAQSFETASEAIRNMGPGWNLGNTLDAHNGSRMTDVVASETLWGQPVTAPQLFVMMKEAGFGAIRVPVTWYPHMNSKGQVDAVWMKRVREVVDYVLDAGLYCILNVHHDTGADSDSHISWLKADEVTFSSVRSRYEYLWRQIATEFCDYGDHLLMESYNEMLDSKNSWCFASFNTPNSYDASIAASAYTAINSYAQSFVDVVRSTGGNNSFRNLVVNTYGACSGNGTWNTHLKDPLKEMKLPDDVAGAGHLIFQIHNYPNISNLAAAKVEVDDMVKALKTHLVAKGAPVIIGEWGTSDSNADYMERPQQLFQFVDYFAQQCKSNDIAIFYWMGLTDGSSRSLPAFNQADLAQRIVKAWRGSSYAGKYPTIDDYDILYLITYTGDWQEANLCSSSISLTHYKGIRVEMEEQPTPRSLKVKCYGEKGEQYYDLSTSSTKTTLTFSSATLGSTIHRITLQTMMGAQQAKLRTAYLLRQDGTEEELSSFSSFWGCSVEMQSRSTDIAQPKMDSPTDSLIYSLQGQRITTPHLPGIYIRNGKKFLFTGR